MSLRDAEVSPEKRPHPNEDLRQAMLVATRAADMGNASPTHYVVFDDGDSRIAGVSPTVTRDGLADVVVVGGPPVRAVGTDDIVCQEADVSSRKLYEARQCRPVGVHVMDSREIDSRIAAHKEYVATVTAEAAAVEAEARAAGERLAFDLLAQTPARSQLVGDRAVAKAINDGKQLTSADEEKVRKDAVVAFVRSLGDDAVRELRTRATSKLYDESKPYLPFVFPEKPAVSQPSHNEPVTKKQKL